MILFVTVLVINELVGPILRVRFRPYKVFTIMHMPKTAIDIDDCFILWQYDIWFARIPLIIFSKTEAISMKETSNYDLWFGIFAPNM